MKAYQRSVLMCKAALLVAALGGVSVAHAANGKLGMISYGWNGSAMVTEFGNANMGQGDAAVAWLTGNVDNDRAGSELLQPFDNGGRLGLISWGWNGSAMVTEFGNANMGQGSGALAWLTADIDRDTYGRKELLQPFDNGGKLGLLVYGWSGSAMVTKWGNADMGQGSGAIKWLVGDVDYKSGVSSTYGEELIQPFDNGGNLGLLVYSWNGSAMVTKWGNANMGQGSAALAWLTADVDNDGRKDLVQMFDNGGRLGMIVYGWNGSAMVAKWGNANMGQGSGALAWLAANVDNKTGTEILQPFDSGGRLGLLVYGWNGSAMVTKWGNANMGQGAGALKWLAADVDYTSGIASTYGDDLVQPFDNGGKLGLLVYGWNGSAMVTKWGNANMGQGSGALAWEIADVDNDGRKELIQPF